MAACPNPVAQTSDLGHMVPRPAHPTQPAFRPVDQAPADPHVDGSGDSDDVVSDWRWGMSGFG